MSYDKNFDTSNFFSGGSGMFIEYHDIIKPAKLYAVFKMIIENRSFGLPLDIIKDFSVLSLIEWYINRRYKNPLKQLDFNNKIDINQLDELLLKILTEDDSIYTLSPELNICKLFQVYKIQHMIFPIYVYSENYESYIEKDCKDVLQGIDFKYVYGDLKKAVNNCDENFTYIFSDIEILNSCVNLLKGTYSHILLANDYRYNYIKNNFKYDLTSLMSNNPIIRIGTINAFDIETIPDAFSNII